MNQQLKRNQRLILIIAGMALIPVILAWVVKQNPQWISGRSNIGQLIIPPVTTERTELIGFDQFSRDNMDELKGHWVMINIIPGQNCHEICLQAIHKTRQLRLMMNKDLTRIRRVVVLLKNGNLEIAVNWWKGDDRLLRAQASQTFLSKINKIIGDQKADGIVIIMDPLGNLMMQYKSGFDPYDVKSDLKKLLRASQIG